MKAIIVGLDVRFNKEEHELFPILGKWYQEEFYYAISGFEDLYLLTKPIPENIKLGDEEVNGLEELGYETYRLGVDGKIFKI